MKLFNTMATALFVATLCLLAAIKLSAKAIHVFPAGVSSLSIFIAIGLVCLVIGLGLRAFSKPPADLSINQKTK